VRPAGARARESRRLARSPAVQDGSRPLTPATWAAALGRDAQTCLLSRTYEQLEVSRCRRRFQWTKDERRDKGK